MLSTDELRDGMPFILQLRNAAGVGFQWIEVLRGDLAAHWLEIYRSSDWESLRNEAAGVFRHAVTETEMDEALKTQGRCISIHTPLVKMEDLRNLPAGAPSHA
jgi:hypothetical protein